MRRIISLNTTIMALALVCLLSACGGDSTSDRYIGGGTIYITPPFGNDRDCGKELYLMLLNKKVLFFLTLDHF